MNDFNLCNFDYIDYIKTPEDMLKFERMKKLSAVFHLPSYECILEVIEFMKLHRELIGLPPQKIIFQNNPMWN